MAEKCSKCGCILFKPEFLDDKNSTETMGEMSGIEQDENDKVIVCLGCSNRNVRMDSKGINGLYR